MKIVDKGKERTTEDFVDSFNTVIDNIIKVRKGEMLDNDEFDEFGYFYPKEVIILQARGSDTREPYVKEYNYIRTILRGVLHMILQPDALSFTLRHRKGIPIMIFLIRDVLVDMGYDVVIYDKRDLLINGKKFYQGTHITGGTKFTTEIGTVIMKHRPEILERILKPAEFDRRQLTCKIPDASKGEVFGIIDPAGLISGLEDIDNNFNRELFLEKLIEKVKEE